jgi:uncharacterized surface protein with fasciclin (FAS1) repeats
MKRHLLIGSLLTTTALLTAGCGASEEPAAAPAESESSETTPSETEEPMESETETMAPAAGPVGAGCAGYAEQVPEGAGSIDGMAQAPVAEAASNNPILTQLVAAVSGGINPNVNLVDTLNGSEFTVFAPVDTAFQALPPETVAALQADGGELLTTVLTYHVVPGRIEPDAVVGTQTTVQGGTLEVAGTPEALTVNGATVICGGVQTANATVYLIDSVLMPPA